MKKLSIRLFMVMLSSLLYGFTWAQQTIDPLQRLEVERGDLSYFASLTFFPGGDSYTSTNEAGEPIQITESFQSFGVSLGGSYSVSSNVNLSAGLALGLNLNSVEVLTEMEREASVDLSTSLGAYFSTTYAFNGDSALDPAVSVSLAYPFALSADVSASLVRDPIVLNGYAGLAKSLNAPGADFYFGTDVGFIANEVISLRFSNSVTIPFGVILPATLSANLRVGYALDPEGANEVGITTYFSVSGRNTSLGLGVDFSGRDVRVEQTNEGN